MFLRTEREKRRHVRNNIRSNKRFGKINTSYKTNSYHSHACEVIPCLFGRTRSKSGKLFNWLNKVRLKKRNQKRFFHFRYSDAAFMETSQPSNSVDIVWKKLSVFNYNEQRKHTANNHLCNRHFQNGERKLFAKNGNSSVQKFHFVGWPLPMGTPHSAKRGRKKLKPTD